MTSILERLRTRPKAKQAAPVQETQAASRLLQAKTGTAEQAPAAPVGAEQERLIATATQMELSDVAQQQQMAQAQQQVQAAGMEQQAAAQRQQVALGQQELTQQRQLAVEGLKRAYEQELEKLGLDKRRAGVESLIFERKLESQEYIRDLQQNAALERAYDESVFKQKAMETALGEDLFLLLNSQKYQALLADDQRSWAEKMGVLDLNSAMEIANTAIKAENTKAIYEGGTQAINAWLDYSAKKEK